ncbi:MAG: hypothetical protein K6G61_04040 [Solobacterium sp.]|nr:hypothetical protein [Solobacterium sp.]
MDNKNAKLTALSLIALYLVLRILAFFVPFLFRHLHALFKLLPLAAAILYILSLRASLDKADHPDSHGQ